MTETRVLITRRMPEIAARLLREAGHAVATLDADEPAERRVLLDRVRGCSAMLATLSDRVDAELLDAAGSQLRIIANYAVGFDNIDVPLCKSRGVRVSNTPGVLTAATADLTWALILAAARHVVASDRFVRDGQWRGWAPLQYLGLELSGATLGIIGAGRIGSAVARRGAAFDMKIVYAHPRVVPELDGPLGARRLGLDDLLRTSDVVSLHVPMRPENRHLLDARRLAMLKPTAVLVNTARGPVIDEAALVESLRARSIAAAGLDVFEREPALHPGLTDLDNAVLLPHLGSATHATREKMAAMAAGNIIACLAGGEPSHAVA
ncbi:MAG: 2-hydroxyacid dehydrogenase [Phycisphaerae bacterium]